MAAACPVPGTGRRSAKQAALIIRPSPFAVGLPRNMVVAWVYYRCGSFRFRQPVKLLQLRWRHDATRMRFENSDGRRVEEIFRFPVLCAGEARRVRQSICHLRQPRWT